jgi:hypothetical protein
VSLQSFGWSCEQIGRAGSQVASLASLVFSIQQVCITINNNHYVVDFALSFVHFTSLRFSLLALQYPRARLRQTVDIAATPPPFSTLVFGRITAQTSILSQILSKVALLKDSASHLSLSCFRFSPFPPTARRRWRPPSTTNKENSPSSMRRAKRVLSARLSPSPSSV